MDVEQTIRSLEERIEDLENQIEENEALKMLLVRIRQQVNGDTCTREGERRCECRR